MVLNFKSDKDNNIWLLYCSFLRLKDESKDANTKGKVSLENYLNKLSFDVDIKETVKCFFYCALINFSSRGRYAIQLIQQSSR